MAIYLGTNKVDLAGLQPGNQLGYMGNSKLIAEKTYSFNLGQTNYSSLTVSTTSQTLTLPATTYTTSPSTSINVFRVGEDYDGIIIDRELHDYVSIGEGKIEYAYTQPDNVMNSLVHGIKTSMCRDYQYGKHYTVSSTGELNTSKNYGGSYFSGQAVLLYKKTDGTYSTTTSYGIYSTSTPVIAYVDATKDYLNLQLSSISVRAHATYFPVDAMNYIDPTNTILTFTWHIYEGDSNVFSRIYQTAYGNAALS